MLNDSNRHQLHALRYVRTDTAVLCFAGALPAGPSCPEHLRERLSHDAAGPRHVGPVCSMDADR